MLNRAGIINVYQYGDETLDFGGGRLLLRGVNGSGKSTAMNMLLPFLLEADTRRIDAAGEQSGVLRSWMLSGREEAQPQGYLWIELRRGDDYLTCGCGIRANQSTDRVTTWWFVTDRRPGIDLALVEQRTPLSADALRSEIGAGAVFAHDQRAGYRAEVRNRLYGGADLDQHLRLLHVVRNPRVGDRIDVDLPRYLEDALPQLSEGALDDAAQPLEDLEQHRRNVTELAKTATTLEALDTVFRAYARAELHRRADQAIETTEVATRRRRAEKQARDTHAAAGANEAAVAQQVVGLDADEARLRVEIESLKQNDAYQSGAELTDLRTHVQSLGAKLADAGKDLDRRNERVNTAADAIGAAALAADEARRVLGGGLAELVRLTVGGGVAARPPDLPTVTTSTLDGTDLVVPTEALAVDAQARLLTEVRAAAATRRGDVREATDALDRIDRAEAAVTTASMAETDAGTVHDEAGLALDESRQHRHDIIEDWRADLDTWARRLAAHRAAHGLDRIATIDLTRPTLADEHDAVTTALLDAAQATADAHRDLQATVQARRATEADTVVELEARVAELDAQTFPVVPTTTWQRPDAGVRLADVIDFADGVTDTERAGLEAAMEAAGLLGAELAPDGALTLDDGQLLVRPGAAVSAPLSALLVPTVAGDAATVIDPDVVRGVLDAITTDAGALDSDSDSATTDSATTVVATDGRFRVGVLRGRHTKATAEHIGVTARRANLERQRAEAALLLADAVAVLAATDHDLASIGVAVADTVAIRAALPSATPVVQAQLRLDQAETVLAQTAERLAEATARREAAEVAHAEAVDASRRLAATLGLPTDRSGLQQIEATLTDLASQCATTERDLHDLRRAVERWREQAGSWTVARDDRDRSAEALAALNCEHEPLAMRLATLEDTIGLEYEAVVAALAVSERDLAQAHGQLEASRARHLDARGAVERARAELDTAEQRRADADERCVAELPHLRAALAVDGLLQSAAAVDAPEPDAVPLVGATDEDEPDPVAGEEDDGATDTAAAVAAMLPVVGETPEGVRELASAIKAMVPPPDTAETSADSVRQSLRRRRDQLGAGWDAEDRQPDESLPLHIEVNGPLGRMALADAVAAVGTQLRRMASLLSAKQDQALRNLLQGLIAREVADKLQAATELIGRMNQRLDTISTSHGIGVALRWRRRDDLDASLAQTVDLLATPPDLRTAEQDTQLTRALSQRIAEARAEDPDQPYRDLIANVLDYRTWHRMSLTLRRPGRSDEVLSRRTALSEGEKKMVSYLPLFAAVAASCDALAEHAPDAPRFVLLDDAFAKVSEDNHPKLFGLLVELDLDFIATSERLWGTHATVPELAITEVLRDAQLGVIVLEHSRWDGHTRTTDP